MDDSWVGQLVPAAPAFWACHDESASTQAGQVVGQDLSGHPDALGQLGRITGTVTQEQQYFGARGI